MQRVSVLFSPNSLVLPPRDTLNSAGRSCDQVTLRVRASNSGVAGNS